MPTTIEEHIQQPPVPSHAEAAGYGSQASPAIFDALTPAAREIALQFDCLLSSAPVDLGRISDEIRSNPGLESFVMGILALLSLSPDDSVRSVEEATIVLGTDRLRVLVNIWLLVREKGARAGLDPPIVPNNAASLGLGTQRSTETLSLGALKQWFGLDLLCPGAGIASRFNADAQLPKNRLADLASLLMSDFISLIPFLDPALMGTVRRQDLVGRKSLPAKEPV
jgi:hypothetical protein